MRDAHFWADSHLLATFDGVWRETQWLETATLVDDDLTKLDRPCRLGKIVAVQAAQRAFVNRLGGAWVPAVEPAVQTELTGSDEFTQASIGGDRYEGSRLPVFRQISLAMADALQARDDAPPAPRARHPTPPRTTPRPPPPPPPLSSLGPPLVKRLPLAPLHLRHPRRRARLRHRRLGPRPPPSEPPLIQVTLRLAAIKKPATPPPPPAADEADGEAAAADGAEASPVVEGSRQRQRRPRRGRRRRAAR